jgi:hypothetical protein
MKRLTIIFLCLALVALGGCNLGQSSRELGAATGSLTVVGATALNGGLTMDTNKFTVADSTGNVVEAGSVSQTQVNAASGSANPWDYTGTLGIMNGTDDFTLFDVNITNANHSSTGNTVQALDIAGITADADATETAINIGNGWDVGLNAGNNSITTSGNVTGARLTATDALIGGGYLSTGCTTTSAGVLKCTAGITSNGALLGNTGATTTTLAVGTRLTSSDALIGGGYLSTGCTMTSAGVLKCTGAMTSNGALIANTGSFTTTLAAGTRLTSADALIGGGYLSSGCTTTSAGVLKCTDDITSNADLLANTGSSQPPSTPRAQSQPGAQSPAPGT